MFPLFCSGVFAAAVLAFGWKRRAAAGSVLMSGQSASDGADQKANEDRREKRHRLDRPAFASVLGDAGVKTPCRILNVSRSGMRIAAPRDFRFPAAAQVQVQWGSDFFIGNVCYALSKEGEQICGLELVASSCARLSGLLPGWGW